MLGGKDMSKMMKQMGMDMEELNADKVEVKIGEKKLVFHSPDISKVDVQGEEIFQLQGSYEEVQEVNEEDIELVMDKTGASKKKAKKALKEEGDVASAVLELQ